MILMDDSGEIRSVDVHERRWGLRMGKVMLYVENGGRVGGLNKSYVIDLTKPNWFSLVHHWLSQNIQFEFKLSSIRTQSKLKSISTS